MLNTFPNTNSYLGSLDLASADNLDKKAHELLNDEAAYERASQALRRRFVRGADTVVGIDRGGKKTNIKREEKAKGKYDYFVQGQDGSWNKPDERIWVVAMYALWQKNK
jgi:hypothetical protein